LRAGIRLSAALAITGESVLSLTETIAKRIADAGGRLRVRSALNPALWLCAIVTVPLVWLASSIPGGPPTWLVVLAYGPVVLATVGFLFLLFFDRNKLQSEDFQIRMRSLELIEQKGGRIAIQATSIEAISNPELPKLPASSGSDGE
jgi:hypothetical protein